MAWLRDGERVRMDGSSGVVVRVSADRETSHAH
jgi:hypothetical protein